MIKKLSTTKKSLSKSISKNSSKQKNIKKNKLINNIETQAEIIESVTKIKKKKKCGKPTMYSKELMLRICDYIALGFSMKKVCEQEDIPVQPRIIFRWLNNRPEFVHKYESSKEKGLKIWAEEIINIADDATKMI